MASPATRHLTILLTDIKGFTDKTSHKTRADIQTMLDEHRAVVLPLLQDGGGTLIKTIGDAFLMTFESPTNAVLAGVAVQEALAKLNEGRAAADRLDIRIAINSGEVNLVEGDVFGEPVNITARIEGIAEAGQVYFTEAVYLAMNKAEVPSSEVGLMQLKGIPEKIRVYKVRREDPIGAVPAAPGKPRLFGLLPPKSASADPSVAPGTKAVLAAPAGPPPPVARRAAALLVDAAACALIVMVVVHSFRLYWVVWWLYNMVLLKSLAGATLGKRLLGLRVVSADGAPLDKRQRMARSATSVLSGAAFFLGYLWALWEPQGLTWHDLLTGTRVISVS